MQLRKPHDLGRGNCRGSASLPQPGSARGERCAGDPTRPDPTNQKSERLAQPRTPHPRGRRRSATRRRTPRSRRARRDESGTHRSQRRPARCSATSAAAGGARSSAHHRPSPERVRSTANRAASAAERFGRSVSSADHVRPRGARWPAYRCRPAVPCRRARQARRTELRQIVRGFSATSMSHPSRPLLFHRYFQCRLLSRGTECNRADTHGRRVDRVDTSRFRALLDRVGELDQCGAARPVAHD